MSGAEWFGARLKQMRAEAGLSLKELAGRAGLTPDAIVKLEAGIRRPAWETVLALAGVFGVSCEEFNKEPDLSQPTRLRGRPPTPSDEPASDAEDISPVPRPRGRPAKAPAAAQDERSDDKPAAEPEKEKKASKGSQGKRRGRKAKGE